MTSRFDVSQVPLVDAWLSKSPSFTPDDLYHTFCVYSAKVSGCISEVCPLSVIMSFFLVLWNLRFSSFNIINLLILAMGHAVAQLVEVLRYKPEGRGFDSRWCHWTFSLTQSFRPHCGPEVDSASNRNEYQVYFLGAKGGRCAGLTTLLPSCAECVEIWEPQPPGKLRACPGL